MNTLNIRTPIVQAGRAIYTPRLWLEGKEIAESNVYVAQVFAEPDRDLTEYAPALAGQRVIGCDNTADAYARLFAAAPDLLAALEEAQATLLHNGIDTGPLPGISQRIRYALSKATGTQAS